MYKKGDYVVKMPEGICKIENVGHPDTTGMNKTKEYYILVPINEKTSKKYLPVDYVDGRIRNMISNEEAIQLIKSIPNITETEIHNEKMREQEYKAAILSGDNKKIVSIIKLIYTRKQGKKSTATDDKYFKQAEDVLFSELSFVPDVPKENMVQFIEDMIKADLL